MFVGVVVLLKVVVYWLDCYELLLSGCKELIFIGVGYIDIYVELLVKFVLVVIVVLCVVLFFIVIFLCDLRILVMVVVLLVLLVILVGGLWLLLME